MADSLQESVLQEGVLPRALRDTKTCCEHRLFWFVEVFIGGAIALAHPVLALVFVAAVFLAILIVNIALAPVRQRDEARTVLENQRDRRLNLDVNVPFVLPIPTENFPTLRHLGKGGLVILLQGLRITNRSKVHNVSLSLTLRVRMDDVFALGADIENPEYVHCYSYKEHHQGLALGQFFFNAINIGPECTESGDMCFPVPSAVLNVHDGKKEVNHHSCLLDIVDHISGEGMTKDIDQRFLESPTAQLVKKK